MATLKDAKEVTDTIVKTIHPHTVVVFGSVVKYGTGNDIDLLIVYDDGDKTIEVLNQNVNKNLKCFYKRFAIDPFVVSLSDLRYFFKKGSPFLRLIQREGRVLYMKDSVKQWLKHSNEDIESAKYLLQGGYFRGACYHSQQAIEKALKSLLIKKGWELEKIHNIERLKEIGEDYGIKLGVGDEDIIFVDSIYRGRYPGEEGLLPLGDPGEDDAKKAVSIAQNILKKIKKYFGGEAI